MNEGRAKGRLATGRQNEFEDSSKVAFCKLYDRKNALVAADMLNDKVLHFFEEQRVLTDRETEYCGARAP